MPSITADQWLDAAEAKAEKVNPPERIQAEALLSIAASLVCINYQLSRLANALESSAPWNVKIDGSL